jgi:hypothetical protein
MGSLVSKEEYKAFLLRLIKGTDIKELKELEEILVDRKNITTDYHTTPGTPNLNDIRSTGEKAFQRALMNTGYSYLQYKTDGHPDKVVWLDLELPVTFNKNARRRSVDLIGYAEDAPILCELKYLENSRSDHPVYAICELLTYYYLIQCNYQKLDSHEVHHKLPLKRMKWESFVKVFSTQLIVAANESYWDYWLEHVVLKDLIEFVFFIIENLDVNLHLFITPDIDFKKQKGSKESYKPMITNEAPWRKLKYEVKNP